MVSLRCKLLVKDELKRLGLHVVSVDLGEVQVKEEITNEIREAIKIVLLRSGLEVMEDKKAMLIEKIKIIVVEMVHYSEESPGTKFSIYLANQMGYDYTYLANLFSETEGTTIEHFILRHKIERVKELIIYDELNITEIASKLNYSSVAHLSNQFKKITGLTPSFFKKLKVQKRETLETL